MSIGFSCNSPFKVQDLDAILQIYPATLQAVCHLHICWLSHALIHSLSCLIQKMLYKYCIWVLVCFWCSSFWVWFNLWLLSQGVLIIAAKYFWLQSGGSRGNLHMTTALYSSLGVATRVEWDISECFKHYPGSFPMQYWEAKLIQIAMQNQMGLCHTYCFIINSHLPSLAHIPGIGVEACG